MLGKLSDGTAAKLMGLTLRAVQQRRHRLGIAAFRGNRPPRRKPRRWTSEEDKMLGTDSDKRIAEVLGREKVMVGQRRRALGIPVFSKEFEWTPQKDALLGTNFDSVIARILGCSTTTAAIRRRMLGIASHGPSTPRWSKEESALLGVFRDTELAEKLGRSRWAIGQKRRSMGIIFTRSQAQRQPQAQRGS